ncbi:hypothetical protein I79_022221 [Cricetulus griseus]|uniref:Uncharacterized protein n=1 Tax=Cricetulus griseus TaxID=10029 RepID=G3IER9_CRIGR|nr:hypothetical protein I79_022221 [Cricetulus griseus]
MDIPPTKKNGIWCAWLPTAKGMYTDPTLLNTKITNHIFYNLQSQIYSKLPLRQLNSKECVILFRAD